jgi:hypothetical protein
MLSQLATNSGNITDRFGIKFDQRYRDRKDQREDPGRMVREEPLVLLEPLDLMVLLVLLEWLTDRSHWCYWSHWI